MTGEKSVFDAPQPGGREPAPGALALVQAFVNTHYDLASERGGETLDSPGALHRWLAARELIDADRTVDHDDLTRVLAVREGLRALAFANNNQRLNSAAIDAMRIASTHAAVQIRIEADGPHFATSAIANIDTALGKLLAHTAHAMIQNTWPRLKACPGRHCGWAFYDHSRNQSARWCSMKICGDREKARAYYQRHITETRDDPSNLATTQIQRARSARASSTR